MSRSLTLACFALVLAGSVSATGCFRAEARTPPPSPGLAVPAPPSRTLVPTAVSLDPTPPPPTTAAPTNPSAPKPADPPPAASTTPPPATAPAKPQAPVVEAPAPVLQTTPDVTGLEAKVKATLGDAETLLGKLEFTSLGREAKDHYNTAVGYVRTAREALGYKAFPYAQALADKALVLAKQLSK
jgi:hypothetical protein